MSPQVYGDQLPQVLPSDWDEGYFINITTLDAETGLIVGEIADRTNTNGPYWRTVWTRIEPENAYRLIKEVLDGAPLEVRVSALLGIGKPQ